MEEKLRKIVVDLTDIESSAITSRTKLNKMGMDSLTIVELICAVEDEFDVEIPNSQIKKFKTIGDVIDFLEKNGKS